MRVLVVRQWFKHKKSKYRYRRPLSSYTFCIVAHACNPATVLHCGTDEVQIILAVAAAPWLAGHSQHTR